MAGGIISDVFFTCKVTGGLWGDPMTAKTYSFSHKGPAYNLPLFGALGKYVFTREMAWGAKQAIF